MKVKEYQLTNCEEGHRVVVGQGCQKCWRKYLPFLRKERIKLGIKSNDLPGTPHAKNNNK